MTFKSGIYKFYERTKNPINYLGNLAAALSFFGGAALWFFANLDGYWPLVSYTAIFATAIMAARVHYLQIQLREINGALGKLEHGQGEIMLATMKALIATKPEKLSITDITSAVHSLKEAGADPKAIEDLLFKISILEKLQNQQGTKK